MTRVLQPSLQISLRAGQDIGAEIIFGPYPQGCTFGINATDNHLVKEYLQVEVAHHIGERRPTLQVRHRPTAGSSHWLLYLLPAKDISEQNVELFFDHKDRLFLKTMRLIQKNEMLFGWYSPSSALKAGFLPLQKENFLGNGYACGLCAAFFLYPNTLKAHLRFHCARTFAPMLLDNRIAGNASSQRTKSKPIHPTPVKLIKTLHPSQCNAMNEIQFRQPGAERTSLSIGLHVKRQTFPENVPEISLETKQKEALKDSCESATDEMEPIHFIPKPLYTPSSGSDKFLCIYCGKLYSRKYGLKIHLRTHTGYKPLKCQYCNRPFGDPSNLNKHLRLHASVAAYNCPVCTKTMVRKRDLERHLHTRHTGWRKHFII